MSVADLEVAAARFARVLSDALNGSVCKHVERETVIIAPDRSRDRDRIAVGHRLSQQATPSPIPLSIAEAAAEREGAPTWLTLEDKLMLDEHLQHLSVHSSSVGLRSRPTLEGLIEFLIRAGLVAAVHPGWQQHLDASSSAYERIQLQTAVRHDPVAGYETLRQIGEPPETKGEGMTRVVDAEAPPRCSREARVVRRNSAASRAGDVSTGATGAALLAVRLVSTVACGFDGSGGRWPCAMTITCDRHPRPRPCACLLSATTSYLRFMRESLRMWQITARRVRTFSGSAN